MCAEDGDEGWTRREGHNSTRRGKESRVRWKVREEDSETRRGKESKVRGENNGTRKGRTRSQREGRGAN